MSNSQIDDHVANLDMNKMTVSRENESLKKNVSGGCANRIALADVKANRADSTSTEKVRQVEKPVLLAKIPRIRRDVSDLTYVNLKKRKIYRDNDDNINEEHMKQNILELNNLNSTTIKEHKLKKIDERKDIDKKNTTEIIKSTEETVNSWKDLDSSEINDICMVVEYTDYIFDHLYKRELETTTKINYTNDPNSTFLLRGSLRTILVDWLVEVHEKFELYPETLFLAINLMDRFLSQNKVTLSKLQLLAVTALFISAKFEEINLPKLSDYSYITDGAASNEDIKTAEMYMLKSLEFNLGWPNPMNFIRRLSKADGYDFKTRNLGKMILEFAICSNLFISVKPSIICAVSMYIARRITNRNDIYWNATFEHYSGGIDALNDKTFREYCLILVNEIKATNNHDSLRRKFHHPKLLSLYNRLTNWCQEYTNGLFPN